MDKEYIINSLKKDRESKVYLDAALEKYSDDFSDFLNEFVALFRTKKDNSKEFEDFALQLIIQRLKQLNCFNVANKPYAKKVFQITLDDIFK